MKDFFCIIISILLSFSLIFFLTFIPDLKYSHASFILLLFICLLIFILEFKKDYFEPIITFTITWCVLYSVIPFILISSEIYTFLDHKDIDPLAIKASAITILALLSFYTGYRMELGKMMAHYVPSFPVNLNRHKMRLCVFVFALTGIFSFYWLVHLNGGFSIYIFHLGNRTRFVQGAGFLKEAINLLFWSTFLYFIFNLEIYKTKKIIIFSFLVLSSITIAILLGGRAETISIITTLLFLYNYKYRFIKFKILLLCAVLFLFFASYAHNLRSSLAGGFENSDSTGTSLIEKVALSGDIFEVTMAMLANIPDRVNFYFGSTYLAGLQAVMPRTLFPGKGAGASWEISKIIRGIEFYHTTDLNIPQSASAINALNELYLNFSIPGILLGYLVFGVLSKMYYVYLIKHRSSGYALFFCLIWSQVLGALQGEFYYFVIKVFVIAASFTSFLILSRLRLPMFAYR